MIDGSMGKTNPCVSLVVLRDLYPQVDHPILKVLKVKEESFVQARVRVPPLILTAGKGVHVEDGVQPF
jgi:hypothetical protein